MDEDQVRQERLKTALWAAVGHIVDKETIAHDKSATPQFIGALTEMVWTLMENTASDLESFANHADRSTIMTKDVVLLTRRNPDLQNIIKDFIEQQRQEKEKEKRG